MSQDIENMKSASSHPKRWGWQTFFGYFSQAWIGPFRVNVFHHGDPGEALHDHAWDFVSFPLMSYVEEYKTPSGKLARQVIPRFRLNWKKAEHCHKVLGRWSGHGTEVAPGKVVTLCYTGRVRRDWFFVRLDGGKVRYFPWMPYTRRIAGRPRKDV